MIEDPESIAVDLLKRATMEMIMSQCCTTREQREVRHAAAQRLMAIAEKMTKDCNS